jgi:hypothetical protein
MSKNDIDAVHTEYAGWKKARAGGLPPDIDPFEVFCAEQFLKDHNLSDEEILSGIVGGTLDGGCDAFFYLLGGKLVRDDSPIPEQHGLTAHLIFMQAKLGEGFSPLQVDRLEALTDDILDIPKQPPKYRRTYHDKLLRLIKLFKDTYGTLHAPRLVLDYYYVTTVDNREEKDCQTSAAHIAETAKRHFSRADVHDFHFINAARFYTQLFERPKFEKKLHFAELMDGTEGYIGLVELRDFYSFLKGDDGELMERIFDDNVRGFQLDTRVNESILKSLRSPTETPEFWLLNNGITILSPDAESLGGKIFRITDPQVVNGLQTSRQLFDYFKAGENVPAQDKRRIVVRVIQNKDEKTREEIIRATNNQNPMPAEALYTTFRIHKQLQALFESNGLYYERRKGYWRDKLKPISKIISAVSLVQAVVAIMKGHPDVARGRPRDYINDKLKRYSIFGHDDYDDSEEMEPDVAKYRPYEFDIYLRCWKTVRIVDTFLDTPELKLDNETKRNVLYYLARCAACAATNNAYCPPCFIAKLDLSLLTPELLREGLMAVRRIYKRYGGNDEAAKSPKMAAALDKWLIKTYSPPKVRTKKPKW